MLSSCHSKVDQSKENLKGKPNDLSYIDTSLMGSLTPMCSAWKPANHSLTPCAKVEDKYFFKHMGKLHLHDSAWHFYCTHQPLKLKWK